MRLFKWSRVLHDHPYLKNLNELTDELKIFFPLADFETGQKLNTHNWLLYLCSDNQPNSIYILNEIAELIRYYKSLGQPGSYQIKTKSGAIDYSHLQEVIFEIHVHYMLSEIGLMPELGQTYLSAEGNTKAMDILVNIGDRLYNVEITKYYDSFKEALLALATEIIGIIQKTTLKKNVTLDEIYSGYFGFKVRHEQTIRKNKEVFNKGVKSYLHGYRSVKETTIILPGKKVTDEYEFHIESAFSNNYESGYERILESFPGYIKFQLRADLYHNKTLTELKVIAKESAAERNVRLIAKIKDKVFQHKNCPHSLLIVIAIEQVFSSHQKNRATAIDSIDIDAATINKLIDGKANRFINI